MDGSSGTVAVREPLARPVRTAGTNTFAEVRSGKWHSTHPVGSSADRHVLELLVALLTLLMLVWIVIEGTAVAGGIDTGIYPTAGLP